MINPTLRTQPNFRWLMIALIIVWLVYAGLSILSPATRAINQYRINLTQFNLLRVSILLPLLLIWLAALFAVVRFRYYAALVSGSTEGKGFKNIARGIFTLFLVIIVPSFISLISNYFPSSATTEQYVTVIRTYATVVLYCLAFWHIFQGSEQLITTLPTVPGEKHSRHRRASTIVVAILALAYAWAIFHNQFRTVSADPLIRPTYFLPDWLIISTIFLPYLLIWLWGSRAILNVRLFATTVSGIVYRKAFLSVSYGLTYILILLIALQFLSQASTIFGRSSLKIVLIVIYALILAIALGYLFLARGARQLSNIEEI